MNRSVNATRPLTKVVGPMRITGAGPPEDAGAGGSCTVATDVPPGARGAVEGEAAGIGPDPEPSPPDVAAGAVAVPRPAGVRATAPGEAGGGAAAADALVRSCRLMRPFSLTVTRAKKSV